jgi:hypothetical protein
VGYCISLTDSRFKINAADKMAAYKAVERLDQTGKKGGGSYAGGMQTQAWFSWVDADFMARSETLEDIFDHWRYPVGNDNDGNIVEIEFTGEKIGDENQLFAAIAPFVEHGSYLEYQGEDGAMWRYVFEGGQFREVSATVVWDAPEPKHENRFR